MYFSFQVPSAATIVVGGGPATPSRPRLHPASTDCFCASILRVNGFFPRRRLLRDVRHWLHPWGQVKIIRPTSSRKVKSGKKHYKLGLMRKKLTLSPEISPFAFFTEIFQ